MPIRPIIGSRFVPPRSVYTGFHGGTYSGVFKTAYNEKHPVRILRTEKNDDGSETKYYSNGTHEVLKVHESGDRYSKRYTTEGNRLLNESYTENGVHTDRIYDDLERPYSNIVLTLDGNGETKSFVETRYEYYGESKAVQKTEVFNSETGETTVTKFAEDGETPTEFFIKKGGVTTYYDPNNSEKILKEVTNKGTVQEVRVPDENGNLVLETE